MWLIVINSLICGSSAFAPFSTSEPPFPQIEHPLKPSELWSASLRANPLPTNRWFQNLVLDKGDSPVQTYPYSVKILDDRVPISLPSTTKSSAKSFVAAWFLAGLSVRATSPFQGHQVVDFDDASVMVDYSATSPIPDQNPYITPNSGGSINYHVTLKYDAKRVQAFIAKNNVQTDVPEIVSSRKDNGDGTFTYQYTKAGFAAGDTTRCRFYAVRSDGSQEFVPGPGDSVWSEDFKYGAFTGTAGTMRVPLVRGSPYVTFLYDGLAPVVVVDWTNVILSVNGKSEPGKVTGNRFELQVNISQTWIIYTSEELTFQWTRTGMECLTSAPTVIVRIAVIDAAVPGQDLKLALNVLDTYAMTGVPISGSWSATVSGDVATCTLRWTTVDQNESAPEKTLMLALPHLCNRVHQAAAEPDLRYMSYIGTMCAYVGQNWSWTEQLDTLTWNAKKPISSASEEDAIRYSLSLDQSRTIPANMDPYNFGKMSSGVAQLAAIADQLGETAAANKLRAELKKAFAPLISGSHSDPFRVDTTWGGIVPLKGVQDRNADYGAGYYNDHYFHYGYMLYAAAVLSKGDSEWMNANKEAITSLARDIANPSHLDPVFTKFRHFDWYAGHSWAAGLFNFADGRNQESTSEAIHAWYGLSLWGLVIGNHEMHNLGRLLLQSEIRGAKTYWQMSADSTVYPRVFAETISVGMVWEDKVDASTWFGSSPVFVFGIQMLPLTPASPLLLGPKWLQDGWPIIQAELNRGSYSTFWKSVVYGAQAGRTDNQKAWAWNQILQLRDWSEGGISNTTSLYYIATA